LVTVVQTECPKPAVVQSIHRSDADFIRALQDDLSKEQPRPTK
jgi:hypothetical protein